jgi:alpha-D-ribose 1-methylphosphonate 5-triphosphate synthase subunit PhnH
MTAIAELTAGFVDKVVSAQSTFRSVMEAMARPGSVQHVAATLGAPRQIMVGTAAIALTLFDHDTPIWLDASMSTSEVVQWLKFHTSAPVISDPSISSFALIANAAAVPDVSRFALGSSEYPDRSTTLIIQVESLRRGESYQLRGPGIDGTVELRAVLEPKDLFVRLAINETVFPRGIDVVLVSGEEIAAIPRTTRLVGQGG